MPILRAVSSSLVFHASGGLAVLLFASIPSLALAQATLLDGFGGDADFGTGMGHFDDSGSVQVALDSAFPGGLNFYGTTYTSIWVNNNGNLTFGGEVTAFTPETFPTSTYPMLAPFWGDVDTSGGDIEGVPGTNETHYHVDTAGGRLIVTWYEVGAFSGGVVDRNSFQAVLTARGERGSGDFDFEFRYAKCEWDRGSASDVAAQLGYDAGNATDYWAHDASQTDEICSIVLNQTNDVDNGVWTFEVINGFPVFCGDGLVDAATEACDDGNQDPLDGCDACVEFHDADGDGHYSNADCDDDDANNFPGNVEVCDDADNDCDGTVDNGLPTDDYYADTDGDGYGADGQAWTTCDPTPPFVSTAGDCDDGNGDIHPGAEELCDGVDNDCDGALPEDEQDRDDDGVAACAGDCDDDSAAVNPGGGEVCADGLDNDCSGDVDDAPECCQDEPGGCEFRQSECSLADASTDDAPHWLWMPFFLALGVIRELARADSKSCG